MKDDAASLLFIGLGLVLGLMIYRRYAASSPSEADQSPSILERLQAFTQPGIDTGDAATAARRAAFLSTIQASEGTADYDDPYTVIFGGIQSPFGYADHPGNLGFTQWTHFVNPATGKDDYSTASGAYQMLLATWNRLKSKLGLADFSPASQDRAALELLREAGALSSVDAGDPVAAAHAASGVWASLPGSPYGQATHDDAFITAAYAAASQGA